MKRLILITLLYLAPVMSALAVGPGHSGSWYWPDQDGHGFSIEVGEQLDGSPLGVVYWYTYDTEGDPIFMVGTGVPSGDILDVAFVSPVGMIFGEFDPASVIRHDGGTGRFVFTDENTATFQYTPSDFTVANWGHSAIAFMPLIKLFGIPVDGAAAEDVAALEVRVEALESLVSGGPLDLWVDGAASGCGGSGCSDLNDGLSPDTAKKTIQAAVRAVPIVMRGPATIHIKDGTYTEEVRIYQRLALDQEGCCITLLGNEGAPQNVVIDGEGVLEDGIQVVGYAKIRGVEVRNFLDSGIEFGYGFTVVENCRILNNELGFEIGQSPGEISNVLVSGNNGGLEVANSQELIIYGNSRFNNNNLFGLHIGIGTHVYIESAQVNDNGTDGIQVESGRLTFTPGDGALVVNGNNRYGVIAQHSSVVEFNDGASLTVQSNGSGSLQSRYHSTIRGYENGSLAGSPPCTANSQSICEP